MPAQKTTIMTTFTDSMFSLCIVLFTVIAGSTMLPPVQSQQITIATMSGWRGILEAAQQQMLYNNVSVKLVVLDTKKSRSTSYDKIDKTYKTLRHIKPHAVIGPYETVLGLATESLHIPYLVTSENSKRGLDFAIQVPPQIHVVAHAMLDLVWAYDWEKISVFYDSDEGLEALEKLMTNHTITVRAWRLAHRAGRKEVRNYLVEMRKVLVVSSIVLCNLENTDLLLDEARNLAMLSTPPHSWVFYDPGDEMEDVFNLYSDIAVNFTVITVLPFNNSIQNGEYSRYRYALACDALNLVTGAYSLVHVTAGMTNVSVSDDMIRNEINRVIRNNVSEGLTGRLEFNANGKRENFTLSLTTITGPHNYLRGIWSSHPMPKHKQLVLYDEQHLDNRSMPFPLKGRTARVVMIQEKPFTMLKRDHMLRKGNDRYEGFAVDLIAEVAKMLDFEYEIYLVHDGKFGSKMANGEWNGMIGELLAGNATMSVASLSINAQREEAVDFTKPFRTRYISVLMKIPKRETSYFEFLNPLSPLVWLCTLGSFLVVSIVLYGLERIGHIKAARQDADTNITVRESFWFIFGSLLQGNTDSTPSTVPGRILTSAWWFFALILISSYTANLAAFLTVKKINTPIKSVTDLAQQTKIKYGTVKDSGIMSFFKNTKMEHFAKMWAQMSEIDPDSMVDNTTQGFAKVAQGNYAFFWDTTVNKYQTIVDCDMMEIGPPFDPKGFGIGVPPGATYRDKLSMAILKLSDRGKLHELETRWWDSTRCPDLTQASTDETSELQIENVAGVFFILVGGIVIAAIVCLGEYFGNAMLKASKMISSTINTQFVSKSGEQDRGSSKNKNEAFL